MNTEVIKDMQSRLEKGRVAIAGLGGLGSNLAVMLARAGVGHLFLVDFDRVEESNLNRQQYFLPQVGKYKTDAICEVIQKINPHLTVHTQCITVTAENALPLFREYDVVCEAFDRPEAKAALVNCLLEYSRVKIVSASGMAGLGDMNRVKTTRPLARLYLCGDGTSEEKEGMFSPRVTACAAHQANAVLRILLGLESEKGV